MTIRRRSFLQGLLPLPTTFLQKRAESKAEQFYTLNRFSIAGFRYYKGPQLAPALRCGDRLTLAPEPDNPYDRYAVSIFWQDDQLGSVPRSDNRHIHRLLQQSAELSCHITELAPDDIPWQMVRVEVAMKG